MVLKMIELNDSHPAPQRSGTIPPRVEPTTTPIMISGLEFIGDCFTSAPNQ